MNGKLTKGQRRFLEYVGDNPDQGIGGFAASFNLPLEAASNLRNHCADAGLVARWKHYDDPVRLTDLGRAALKQGEPM